MKANTYSWLTLTPQNQLILIAAKSQLWLFSWIQAFSIDTAGLVVASLTTKEQVMGLMARMF